jgi:hypothetical protein
MVDDAKNNKYQGLSPFDKLLKIISIDEELFKLHMNLYHYHRGGSAVALMALHQKISQLNRERGYMKQSLQADIRTVRKSGIIAD